MHTPIATAFDSIMDLMQLCQKHGELADEPDFRKHMDAARGLLDYISAERNGTLYVEEAA